jgi:tRNA threonylcarbamoyladenosine biosynthesis protein TsaB
VTSFPIILAIETATSVCAAAILRGEEILANVHQDQANIHGAMLVPMIEEAFKIANLELAEIDAIAYSAGPGSFTGLRIGLSTAKGLAMAADKPLISVPTLEALALSCIHKRDEQSLWVPMLDARRMEVYLAAYDNQGTEVIQPQAWEMDKALPLWEARPTYFFGDGAPKLRVLLEELGWTYLEASLSAQYVGKAALPRYLRGEFENLQSANPVYLKKVMNNTAINSNE